MLHVAIRAQYAWLVAKRKVARLVTESPMRITTADAEADRPRSVWPLSILPMPYTNVPHEMIAPKRSREPNLEIQSAPRR